MSTISAIGINLATTAPHIIIAVICVEFDQIASCPDKQGENLSYSLSSEAFSRVIFPIVFGSIYDKIPTGSFYIAATCGKSNFKNIAIINLPIGYILRNRVKAKEDLASSNATQKYLKVVVY